MLSKQKSENSVAFPDRQKSVPGVTGETDPTKMSRIELLRSGMAKPGPFDVKTGLSKIHETANRNGSRCNSSETDKKKKVMFADDNDDLD